MSESMNGANGTMTSETMMKSDSGAKGVQSAAIAAAIAANNEPATAKAKYRAGFVAFVGEPNAGKSTLLNAILKEKVSIVSDKPQTTRARVTGILNRPDAQVIFVDAPGMITSTSGINKFLQEEIKDVLDKADVVCALLSAEATEKSAVSLIETLKASRKPWVAIVTKSDLLGGTRTPRFFQYLIDEKIPFVSISGLTRPEEAAEELLNRVLPLLPPCAAPLYDTELYTTQTMRQMTAELVREACFENLRQEIPYGLAVKILSFNEEGPITRIACELLINKPNHKGIVIGAGGSMLKKIGQEARAEIEKIVGNKCYLELHVHVKENWVQNPRLMKELGYVVAEE
jgi:GTP-binding protein Era